jgi:hypothetical protein
MLFVRKPVTLHSLSSGPVGEETSVTRFELELIFLSFGILMPVIWSCPLTYSTVKADCVDVEGEVLAQKFDKLAGYSANYEL